MTESRFCKSARPNLYRTEAKHLNRRGRQGFVRKKSVDIERPSLRDKKRKGLKREGEQKNRYRPEKRETNPTER